MTLNKISYSCVLCARTFVELTPRRLVACPRCAIGGQHPRLSRMRALIDGHQVEQRTHRLQAMAESLS